MVLARYKMAATGAVAEKELSQVVYEYLQTHWADLVAGISPGVKEITFNDTFEGINTKYAVIVVDPNAITITPGEIGEGRKSHEHVLFVYVLGYGEGTKKGTWTMAENIFDLVDSDSDAITPIEEASISQFTKVNNWQDESEIMKGMLQAEGSYMRKATMTCYYDKVL